MITCEHRDRVRPVAPRADGCEECLRSGDRWVQLRACLTCGHVGCCDSSRGRHAMEHFETTDHPLMRSAEPGETWSWCYVDRQGFDTAEPAPPGHPPPAAPATEPASVRPFVDALNREFLVRGVDYFFADAQLEIIGPATGSGPPGRVTPAGDGAVEFDWLGFHHHFSKRGGALSGDERAMLASILRVLSVRHEVVFDAALAAQSLHLFRGLPEDRFVSAFLDPSGYADPQTSARVPDRVSQAIEVLRLSALTTYENRRVETGVLLFGAMPDACHVLPPRPADAVPYASALASIRSFHRLCDGLQTLALVDRAGLLVELVDVQRWAEPYAGLPLPVPTIGRYRAHCEATLCGGHVCLVLTPNGEIKIFADGAQRFSFLDGRWRLSDSREKYAAWRRLIGDEQRAERLFTVALDLADDRRGALFLILDDAAAGDRLLSQDDLLTSRPTRDVDGTKQRLHYLLRDEDVLHIAPAVLESIARIDGAVVLDPAGRLVAFGAILRVGRASSADVPAAEGGRTTAALAASRFGKVLMVSEDGRVSLMYGGRRVWQL